jgi:hypothetical protein
MNTKWIKLAFGVSAVYDAAVALLFLLFGLSIYDSFGIERPNHDGYLQFPALLIMIFSAMYWRIATDPVRFRDLMPYGIGLKISFSAVVLYHWFFGNIPPMWMPFAWLDVAFTVIFLRAWTIVRKDGRVQG